MEVFHVRPSDMEEMIQKVAGGASKVHFHKALKRLFRLFSRPFDHDYSELGSILAFSSQYVHDQD
jgi:hypothetical protein